MADPKASQKNVLTLIAGLFVLALIGTGAYFLMTGQANHKDINLASVKGDTDAPKGYPPMPQPMKGSNLDELGAESNNIEPAATDTVEAKGEVMEHESLSGIELFLADRGVGDPNAPVRIDEFASLTCSHCAHFNNDTYPALKEKYIDTGKVYFVYNDYPLDRAALDAAITARCLPIEQHEAFIKLLFKTQRQWAADGYMKALQQNAKLAGLSDEQFKECHENAAYKNGLEGKIKEAQENHKIQSTPTFVLNGGKETIRGASSIKSFEQVIEKLLSE